MWTIICCSTYFRFRSRHFQTRVWGRRSRQRFLAVWRFFPATGCCFVIAFVIALVWLIALLACSAPFLFRMNMAKAPPLAIIYLIIAIHLFFKRKYWPLLPLALVFTWTYDLFVLLIMATVFWVVTIAITEKRFEWRPLVFVLVGCAAGMVINPYFPQNLQLLVEHMQIKLTASDFNTKVGSEWYPYDSWEFLGNSAVACIAMFVGYIAFEPSERRRAHYPIFFLLLSTALMIMTARWKRIAEYWPPFAVLFAGFALAAMAGGLSSISHASAAEMYWKNSNHFSIAKECLSLKKTLTSAIWSERLRWLRSRWC